MRYERRRAHTLKDVNLNINRGDFVAVTGPNGGGKTTLLRILLKLLKPTAGTVRYLDANGCTVKHLPIGYLPQKNNIDTRFPITVREVVQSGLPHRWLGRLCRDASERLDKVVELTSTASILDRSIGELSGGQLQRALLARALASDPQVLVLDEPLSYVDKRFEQQIYAIIEELSRHTTIVLVSHEMSTISGMANRHLIVDHTVHMCHALHHYVPPTECDV